MGITIIFLQPNKKRMLLFSSYVFYGMWNPPLVILLWISTMVDWTAGKKLTVEDNQKKRKFWLLLSMSVNLGFLGFFKYGDFLLENFVIIVNSIGVDFQAKPMDIILPMGISFYTFQTMSYTIDMYKRKTEYETLTDGRDRRRRGSRRNSGLFISRYKTNAMDSSLYDLGWYKVMPDTVKRFFDVKWGFKDSLSNVKLKPRSIKDVYQLDSNVSILYMHKRKPIKIKKKTE